MPMQVNTAGIVIRIPILASSFLETLPREYMRVIGGVPMGVMKESDKINATGSTSSLMSTLMATERAMRIGVPRIKNCIGIL